MSLTPVINIHPDLLKLICKPGEMGHFCPICSDMLKDRKGSYHDFICINVGHTFTVYETSLRTACYDKIGFFLMINDAKYNITFNFEKKEIGFFDGIDTIYIKDCDFIDLEDLMDRVDTYILFS